METAPKRRRKKARVRKISLCESRCHLALVELGLNPSSEHRIRGLPRLRFDFFFEYGGNSYLLEYDGDQHFEFCQFLQRYPIRFRRCQQHDVLKTTVALLQGYYVLRLDDRTVKTHLKEHIIRAIQTTLAGQRLYFSNPERYQWLSQSVVFFDRILQYGGDLGPEIVARATGEKEPTTVIKLRIT